MVVGLVQALLLAARQQKESGVDWRFVVPTTIAGVAAVGTIIGAMQASRSASASKNSSSDADPGGNNHDGRLPNSALGRPDRRPLSAGLSRAKNVPRKDCRQADSRCKGKKLYYRSRPHVPSIDRRLVFKPFERPGQSHQR